MVKRLGWSVGLAILAILAIAVLAGCSQQQTSDTGGGKTETKVTVPQTVDQKGGQPAPAGSPAAAAPKAAASPGAAASPAPAPAQQGEPRGRMIYGWHTAITPSWVDPLENPALITPYAFQYALHDAVIKHMPG